MALKNFSFRENWVGREVAGMKIAFLPFLTQHGLTFWLQKGQNMEFLKQNFNFQSLFLIQNGQRFCSNFLLIWCF